MPVAAHEPVLFPAVQLLDENLVVHRLKADAGQVEIEFPVSPRHIAHGLDRDAGNVDGKLVPQGDGLGHDFGHVHLFGDAFQFPLRRGDDLLDLLDDLLLDFRLGQVGGTRQALELLADDFERRLGRLLLLRVLEEQLRLLYLVLVLPSATVAEARIRLHDLRLGHHNLGPLVADVDDLQAAPDDGIRAVGVVHDLLELVVRDDGQPVHRAHARPLAVGQAQAAADGLLHQRLASLPPGAGRWCRGS